MGLFFNAIKIGTKAGVLGGSFYLANEYKVFSAPEESKLNHEALEDYTKIVKSSVQDAKKSLGISTDFSIGARTWNAGVIGLFNGIRKTPETISSYVCTGVDKIVSAVNSE